MSFKCNPPYVTFNNECCLDSNDNGVCDREEWPSEMTTTTAALEEPTTSTTQAAAATASTTTTTTTATTTTTFACRTNRDCGADRNYTKCHDGNVVMYYEKPACKNGGTPEAACVRKSSVEAYHACKTFEVCVNAECVNASEVSCSDACVEEGYADWYCHGSQRCRGSDVRAPLGDAGCQPDYCCCNASTTTTIRQTTTTRPTATTTTLRQSTTTTLWEGDCADAGCRARCIAEFGASDAVCEGQPQRHSACPVWVNRGDRRGCYHQGCGGCCSGHQWGTECGCICLGPLYGSSSTTTTLRGTTTTTLRATTTTTAIPCSDPDGSNSKTKSTCTDSTGSYADTCTGGQVQREYYCSQFNNRCTSVDNYCTNLFGATWTCINGQCAQTTTTTTTLRTTTTTKSTTTTLQTTCTDQDNSASFAGAPALCQTNTGGSVQSFWDYCLSATSRRSYYCSLSNKCTAVDNTCWNGYGSSHIAVCCPRDNHCRAVQKSTCNNMCRDAGAASLNGNYGNCGATSIAWGDTYWWDISGATDCTGGNPYCHCRKR